MASSLLSRVSRGSAASSVSLNRISSRGKASRVSRPRRHVQVCRASLDPTTALAATQQLVALGVFVGGEAGVSFNTMRAGSSGRPNLPVAGVGIVGLIAASQLVSNPDTAQAGLVAGAACCGALVAWSAKRTKDTEHISTEWPGPKAWPVSSAVASFFGLVLCVESLLQ